MNAFRTFTLSTVPKKFNLMNVSKITDHLGYFQFLDWYDNVPFVFLRNVLCSEPLKIFFLKFLMLITF